MSYRVSATLADVRYFESRKALQLPVAEVEKKVKKGAFLEMAHPTAEDAQQNYSQLLLDSSQIGFLRNP